MSAWPYPKTPRFDCHGVNGMAERDDGDFAYVQDVLLLEHFSTGALEHLLRLINGDSASWPPDDDRSAGEAAKVRAELDARYTKIEEEVPGWRR